MDPHGTRSTFRARRLHQVLAVALGTAVLAPAALLLASPASAAEPAPGSADADVRWDATIDGHDIGTATGNKPVPLRAGGDAQVALTVDNNGPDDVMVRSVRLEGRVIGMSFFSFSTRVDLPVAAGASEQRTIQLDLGDLADQATGLIPARMSLVGADREVISDRRLATDVRGSLGSAYGVFGLAVAAITLILIVGLALEISRHSLPHNRWRRAVRFLAPGLGLGLTATFTLSATRLLLPSATVWVPLVLGCGGIAFLVGYLTPTPVDEADEVEQADEVDVHGYPQSMPLSHGGGMPQVVDLRQPQALESDVPARRPPPTA